VVGKVGKYSDDEIRNCRHAQMMLNRVMLLCLQRWRMTR